MTTRRIKWLWDRRISTVQYPVEDTPTMEFPWGYYFKDGTYECYELFRSPHKICSYKGYKWHIAVLKHINNLTTDKFKEVCLYIADVKNGFVARELDPIKVWSIVADVLDDDTHDAPPNVRRKVIFKVGCSLEAHEKKLIIGQLTGRIGRLKGKDVSSHMMYIHHMGRKITITELSKLMNCSRVSVYSIMDDDLNSTMKTLNESLSNEKLQRAKLLKVQI